jgi:arylsulfatase A-like enzyme
MTSPEAPETIPLVPRRAVGLTPARAGLLLAVLGLGLGLLGGCRRAAPAGFALRRAVESGSFAVNGSPLRSKADGLVFPVKPELRPLDLDHEHRPVVLLPAGAWTWRGRVPSGATLHAGLALLPPVWDAVEQLEATIEVRDEDRQDREVLAVGRLRRAEAGRWLDLDTDLGRWAGRKVVLIFSAALDGLPPRYRSANLVAWGPVALVASGRSADSGRPNILFILVDTLRRDRLTPYGYRRDTSPEIARRLAAAGTVCDDAYSQAPWTLPSVVSFMTGRFPGELLGEDLSTFGVPPGVETMAERMEKLGYETGGYLANPTLHVGAGFERGFRSFFAPPADVEWLRKHADSLNARALPWLRAHQGKPFFLYVHYIDPHDPYENPEVVNGRSPFLPGYDGPVTGEWVHGIYTGHRQLPDPARDLRQINALYDTEVHYVDRAIGELLAAIPPVILARTLVVLTADHGEEIHDHGGWKHGQTLYEEQIHVPLIVRWDGHVPAGRRLAGTVRLLDLLPTLSHAAGGRPDPAWQGIDVLPSLTGERPLPDRPAFAHGLSGGPLRVAAVRGHEKLILFNREEPFRPADPLQAYLWTKDLERLQRVELYDLAADPAERRNLYAGNSPPSAERAAALAPIVFRQLDRELGGLKVMTDGLPAGSRLGGSIVFSHAPQRAVPYFLAPGDRVEMTGDHLRFDLVSEPLAKGFRIDGDFGRILGIEVTLDGQPLPPARLRVGPGRPYAGGGLGPGDLLTAEWPGLLSRGAGLDLWIHDTSGAARRRARDPETERRLRALGYID